MSDVSSPLKKSLCRRGRVIVAEDKARDITALRIIRDPSPYTPYAVEFRYQGVGPDAEPIDREDTLALVETLREQVGRALEEAEDG